MKAYPFIVLEGLSGVGKSTIARLLAQRLGGCSYITPPPSYRQDREAIDASTPLPARYLYYLSGLVAASAEIRALRRSGPVVCDRFALTTECFHRAAGLVIPFCHVTLQLERPTLQVLIAVPTEQRVTRLEERGLSFNDRWERADGLEDRMLGDYRRHGLVEISNASPDPADAAHAVLELLRRGRGDRTRACRREARSA